MPSYLYKIEKDNPGTITKLEIDAQKWFKYLFIAFGTCTCIKGFLFMRRVIVVDGAHLSGKFKGVMLVAACQNGNRDTSLQENSQIAMEFFIAREDNLLLKCSRR